MDYVFFSRLRRNTVKEVISIKMWHKILWRRGWKELRSWFAPKDDPAQEFECYVPTYVCLAVLGFVSYTLLQPCSKLARFRLHGFYSLGGISVLFCTVLLIGIVVWQPKTRAQQIRWRSICAFAVAVAVAFVTIMPPMAFVASKTKLKS